MSGNNIGFQNKEIKIVDSHKIIGTHKKYPTLKSSNEYIVFLALCLNEIIRAISVYEV